MSNLDYALSYAAEYNFAVFPVHGVHSGDQAGQCTCGNTACTNIGKHPATRNGLKDASSDQNKIENLFASNKPYNIAVATGPISGIFVIDIDGMEGEAALKDLEAAHGVLPKTMTSITGRGRHLVFRYPENLKIKNSTSKIGLKIDVRGDGGYIIIPPSLHHSGVIYQWDTSAGWDINPAPQWLLDLTQAQPEREARFSDGSTINHAEWSADDVAGMLDALDPDMPYEDWVSIGMALNEGGYHFNLFNSWSSKGSKYKGVKDCEFHWKSFRKGGGITMGTLVSMAQVRGWQPPVSEHDNTLQAIGRAAAEAIMANRVMTAQASSGETLTIDFDALPGVIGQTVKWILLNAQKPQPELALLNTLTALGAVFGRRYRSPLDTRTNIYTVGIAGTAAGKNHSKKSIKNIMVEAGLTDFLGPETIVSGAGLISAVFKNPSHIMHLDEFGMLLEAIMDKRGASHLKTASRVVTELFSNSSEKYYGGQYSDVKRDQTIISCPNLCIFGISTLEKYTSSLNREAISSGELNRFVVIRAAHDSPQRRRGVQITPPPEWMVAQWAAFKPQHPQNGLLEVTPETVPWPGLQDRIDDMGDWEDTRIIENRNGAGALWGRYRENVIKVAMIFAIARNHLAPVMVADDLDIAEALVRQSVDFMVNMVSEYIADSDHERDCNDLLREVKKAKNKTISRSDLCRVTRRMDIKQRDMAIASLIEQGRIIAENKKQNGPGPRVVYYKYLI